MEYEFINVKDFAININILLSIILTAFVVVKSVVLAIDLLRSK
ncbi:hypothetical protein [Campylobacter pinnipediorum]|nr:hypothetical protein [Campylobacter pinnipediorum]